MDDFSSPNVTNYFGWWLFLWFCVNVCLKHGLVNIIVVSQEFELFDD